jgi:predicted acyltransferase
MSAQSSPAPTDNRIASLDQYRGYAIFGMLLVNFFGHYKTEWVKDIGEGSTNDAMIFIYGHLKTALDFIFGQQLHHHGEYMTYADTIAPIFMFVVGIGMRLSWTRRMKHSTAPEARKSMGKRYFTLVLIAFAIYTGWLWDALMNIGLAGLVALLIVDKRWSVRIAYALGLVVAFQLIFSYTSYGEWLLRMGKYGRDLDWPLITLFIPLRGDLMGVPINGGLIGHWSWAFMLIFGTIAYDIMATQDSKKIVTGLVGFGLALTIAGWGVRHIGTASYYDKAEPYAAARMLEGEMGDVNKIVGKSPGIFSSIAKGNDDAEKALSKQDMAAFAELMKPELTALAEKAPEEAPRLANGWVFSKNYQTMPFTFWATALCLFHLLLFYVICDVCKLNVPGMMVMGLNPLFIYIFQSLTLEMFSNILGEYNLSRTTSGTLVLGSFVVYFGLIYAMAHYMYKRNIIVKL